MSRFKPKVLVVGAGSPNADMVAEVLRSNGVDAQWTDRIKFPSLKLIWHSDIVYGVYLQTCSRYILAAKLLGKKTILHFVGSDAYRFARENAIHKQIYWGLVLWLTDLVFYVSPHLMELTHRKGVILPFPIATESFKEAALRGIEPERDVLYYCPGGPTNEAIYRLSWILEYARKHPDEKITIIGSEAHPATYHVDQSNVSVVLFVEPSQMPLLYRKHRKLIRMTTEDGLSRMIHEALLCGLKVIYNREEVTEIPPEREPVKFAEKFIQAIGPLE
jgi:hypothetical protein